MELQSSEAEGVEVELTRVTWFVIEVAFGAVPGAPLCPLCVYQPYAYYAISFYLGGQLCGHDEEAQDPAVGHGPLPSRERWDAEHDTQSAGGRQQSVPPRPRGPRSSPGERQGARGPLGQEDQHEARLARRRTRRR